MLFRYFKQEAETQRKRAKGAQTRSNMWRCGHCKVLNDPTLENCRQCHTELQIVSMGLQARLTTWAPDIDTAVQLAKDTNKLIFIHVGRQACMSLCLSLYIYIYMQLPRCTSIQL